MKVLGEQNALLLAPQRVADAVVEAIRRNPQEIIVRPTPTRPLLALNALSPRLGSSIIKVMGISKLQRQLEESSRALEHERPAGE